MLKEIGGCYTDFLLLLLPTSTLLNSECLMKSFYPLSVFQDTVIYDRLAETSKYKEITLKHLEQFATEGKYNSAIKHD